MVLVDQEKINMIQILDLFIVFVSLYIILIMLDWVQMVYLDAYDNSSREFTWKSYVKAIWYKNWYIFLR